jgi:hypothetical protein
MKFSTGRPTPAMVVAVFALVFAMVGSAVAGTDGLSSKITKSKVKSISKKQADKELKANVSGSHVNTADKATSADNATNATNATNAQNATNANTVNGLHVDSVDYNVSGTNGPTVVFERGGLVLRGQCAAATLTVTAQTTVNDAMIHVSHIDLNPDANGNHATYAENDSFDIGDTFNATDPIAGVGDSANIQIVYQAPGGRPVTVDLTDEEADGPGNPDCTLVGNAIG